MSRSEFSKQRAAAVEGGAWQLHGWCENLLKSQHEWWATLLNSFVLSGTTRLKFYIKTCSSLRTTLLRRRPFIASNRIGEEPTIIVIKWPGGSHLATLISFYSTGADDWTWLHSRRRTGRVISRTKTQTNWISAPIGSHVNWELIYWWNWSSLKCPHMYQMNA